MFLFSSCAINSSDTPKNESATSSAESSICHFSGFEVSIPSGWTGAGNTTKFYCHELHPSTYLLVGDDSNPEEDIAKNLELFESTKFYKNKIKFVYEIYDDEFVSGVLVNERLERDLYFSGYYLKKPSAYIFCACETSEDKDFCLELVKNVYSSLYVLD